MNVIIIGIARMASIWRHPGSQYWTACFRDATGRQRRISTKATDKKTARKIAEEYQKSVRIERTLKQLNETLDRFHEEFSGQKVVRATLRGYVLEWLATKEPETARSTLAFYRGSLGKFVSYLGERADAPLARINRTEIVSFRNALAAKLSSKTVNHDLKAVRMLFRSARRDGLITEDPAEFVEPVRRENRPAEKTRRNFTLEELRVVLDAADSEWRSMILFGLYTGQRLGDIATLCWSNIDLSKGELRLRTRKTARTMILPLAEPLRHHLENLDPGVHPEIPLHPRAFALINSQKKSSMISRQFGELLAQAGLREHKPHRSEGKGRGGRRTVDALTFHGLRRTATTLLHEAGIPAAVAQALIGHDSEAVHELYISVGREALQKAADTLPRL
jgi:integrase